MKTKLVPFNIEKAKQGAKVVTRDNCPVRILCYDLADYRMPIIAAIKKDGKEIPYQYTAEGNFYPNREEDAGDLFIEEEVEERYMTYYEVAMWLTEKPYRQYKSDGSTWVYSCLNYYEEDGNEAADTILIREKGGDWHRPLIEEQNQNTLNPLNNEETEK